MLARTNIALKDHKTIWESRKLHSKHFSYFSRWVPLRLEHKLFTFGPSFNGKRHSAADSATVLAPFYESHVISRLFVWLPLNVFQVFSLRCGGFIPVKYPVRRQAKSNLKKFGRHFELAKQKFNFSSRDPSNYMRARHARMAQFWLKIAHLSFSIATTPLLKMMLMLYLHLGIYRGKHLLTKPWYVCTVFILAQITEVNLSSTTITIK